MSLTLSLGKGWAEGCRRRGWRKSDGKPALNSDLWNELLALSKKHTVNCHWVKGHSSSFMNNRCDELAVFESRKFTR